MQSYFFPFTSLDDDFEDFEWCDSDEFLRTVCGGCGGVAVGHHGLPCPVVVRREPRIFDPAHPGPAILPVDYARFLRAFDFKQEIIWGSVLVGKRGQISDLYVTGYMPGTCTMHPRGDERSVYSQCVECGSRASSMYENGVQYITSNWCSRDILFEGGRNGPFISEKLHGLFDWTRYRGVEFERYPVKVSPEDGFRLPGDPDWATICPDFRPNPRTDWTKRGRNPDRDQEP